MSALLFEEESLFFSDYFINSDSAQEAGRFGYVQERLTACGTRSNTVRLSIGAEHIDDISDDTVIQFYHGLKCTSAPSPQKEEGALVDIFDIQMAHSPF